MKGAGPATRWLLRRIPGAAAGRQKEAVGAVRGAVESLPAPSADPLYSQLESLYEGGHELISASGLQETAAKLAKQLKPVLKELGKSLIPAKQEAARKVSAALEKAGKSRGAEFTVQEIQDILERLGPETQREVGGKAAGAIKNLWGTTKETLQAAAEGGSEQATALLKAQAAHKRSEAVKSLKSLLEPSQPGAAIRIVPKTKGLEEVSGAGLLEALPPARRVTGDLPFEVQRLSEALSAPEMRGLRSVFEQATAAPPIRTGWAGLGERLALYVPMAAAGLQFGGAPGIVASGLGAEGLRRFFMTPAGMRFVQRLARPVGRGVGTRAAQVALPALGGEMMGP